MSEQASSSIVPEKNSPKKVVNKWKLVKSFESLKQAQEFIADEWKKCYSNTAEIGDFSVTTTVYYCFAHGKCCKAKVRLVSPEANGNTLYYELEVMDHGDLPEREKLGLSKSQKGAVHNLIQQGRGRPNEILRSIETLELCDVPIKQKLVRYLKNQRSKVRGTCEPSIVFTTMNADNVEIEEVSHRLDNNIAHEVQSIPNADTAPAPWINKKIKNQVASGSSEGRSRSQLMSSLLACCKSSNSSSYMSPASNEKGRNRNNNFSKKRRRLPERNHVDCCKSSKENRDENEDVVKKMKLRSGSDILSVFVCDEIDDGEDKLEQRPFVGEKIPEKSDPVNSRLAKGKVETVYFTLESIKPELSPKKFSAAKAVAETGKTDQEQKQQGTPTPTVDACSTDTNVPVQQIALSDKHILDRIFRSFNNSDLLKCRTVCHRWNSIATSRLQQNLQLTVSLDPIKFEKLTNLLEKHSSNLPSSPFPCSKFHIHFNVDPTSCLSFLASPKIQMFLTLHGVYIQELSLRLHLVDSAWPYPPHESAAMEQIRNLIIHQGPNISTLWLDIDLEIDWKKDRASNNPLPLRKSDPEFQEIHLKFGSSTNPELNTKLKFLYLPRTSCSLVSSKLVEMIILLAPNLEEIIPSKQQHYLLFVEPLNRLNLLRKMDFDPRYLNDIKAYEKIVKAGAGSSTGKNGKLKLREISFILSSYEQYSEPWNVFGTLKMKTRVVNVINRILECSYDSLETIGLGSLTYLPGVQLTWPKVMPGVSKLVFDNPNHDRSVNETVFPSELLRPTRWSEKFPNLTCVCLRRYKLDWSLLDFLNCEPLTSVKRVEVHLLRKTQIISSDHLQKMKVIFPSAQVVKKVIMG